MLIEYLITVVRGNCAIGQHDMALGGYNCCLRIGLLQGDCYADVIVCIPVVSIKKADWLMALIHGRQGSNSPWGIAIVLMGGRKLDMITASKVNKAVGMPIRYHKVSRKYLLQDASVAAQQH